MLKFALIALVATVAGPPSEDWVDGVRVPTEIPMEGALPTVVKPALLDAIDDMRKAAEYGPYTRQLRRIARSHFGRMRDAGRRLAGLEKLRDFTDSGALFAMPFVLGDEQDDVRDAVFRHLSGAGAIGQAALAWAAVHHEDESIRAASAAEIRDASEPLVLAVIESGLRDNRHEVVNRAGHLASMIDAVQVIPLLIFSQYSRDPVRQEGDLAWIAIGTQRSYVQNLIPVTGNGAGAFQPVIGTVTEGVVLRVVDAVAIVYRTDVHRSLVRLSSSGWGRSTSSFGWDMAAWREWYNTEYLAVLQAREKEREILRRAEEITRREESGEEP